MTKAETDVREQVDQSIAVNRLERWRHVLRADSEGFERRLALDGVTEIACRGALGSRPRAEGDPPWLRRLLAVLRGALKSDGLEAEQDCPTDAPLPFEHILAPFMRYGRRVARRRLGTAQLRLSEGAWAILDRDLLRNLAFLASPALGLEFRLFRASLNPLSVLDLPTTGEASRESYQRFVRHMLGNGLVPFLNEYAVLARALVTTLEHWIAATVEFCRRLDDDLPVIAATFLAGKCPGLVVDVSSGLSDRHQGGRSVAVVTFASGLKLVYKPKEVGTEAAFFALVDWLNARSTMALRTLRVIDRGSHGWVEFAEATACQSDEEVARYFERLGGLLCLAYTLGTNDLHFDNLIAAGEHPIVVDLETLLQPVLRANDGDFSAAADTVGSQALADSVLSSGLLPCWRAGEDGKVFDVSGLGAESVQETGIRVRGWQDVNTDRMTRRPVAGEMRASSSIPTLRGLAVSAGDYRDHVATGFCNLYRALLAARSELLNEEGPLKCFRGLTLRFVFRPTQVYARLLNRLRHPEFLRDGRDWSIELEALAGPFIPRSATEQHLPPWEIYLAERHTIERLDIPRFIVGADDTALHCDGRVVAANYFAESGFQRATNRLRRLDEIDLRRQLGYIHAAFHARFTADQGRHATLSDNVCDVSDVPLPAREDFLTAASRIAEQIRDDAIRGSDGSVAWIRLGYVPETERLRLELMGNNLYDGRCGVALFLAAFESETGEGYRNLALAALAPVRQFLSTADPDAYPCRRKRIGGGSGLGGIVYALTRIARLLGELDLVDDARRAARFISPSQIALDETLDVIGGAAGAILGLLALAEEDPTGEALERATECGRHLLTHCLSTAAAGPRWKPGDAAQPLTGFSHGAAGMAHTLLRLSSATGDEWFRRAAEEAIEYERQVFVEETGNWPDFRPNTDQPFMVAWCHGATGIGLARLGSLAFLDTPWVRREIEVALNTTRSCPAASRDHVCCGNAGRVDFFVEAANRLGRPDLLDDARVQATRMLQRSARSGHFELHTQLSGIINSPSFFQGTAGIGYTLLRLVDPQKLKCVLLWD